MDINWTSFTPMSALLGGTLIGISASLLLLLVGRIAGVSGIVGGLFRQSAGDVAWRIAFLGGLMLAPIAWSGLLHLRMPMPSETLGAPSEWMKLGIGGLLVGFGSRLGNGCTSGHGVCGLARLSRRSLAAVVVFMTTAALTVFVARHGVGI